MIEGPLSDFSHPRWAGHQEYKTLGAEALRHMVKEGGLLADLKGIWRRLDLGDGVRRWSL